MFACVWGEIGMENSSHIQRFGNLHVTVSREANAEMEKFLHEQIKEFNNQQLRTFGFQARGFYEKQGYRVVGALEDYPPGNAMFWMRKDLAD